MLKATRRVSYNNEGASYLCSNENYKYLTPPYVTKNPLSPPVELTRKIQQKHRRSQRVSARARAPWLLDAFDNRFFTCSGKEETNKLVTGHTETHVQH